MITYRFISQVFLGQPIKVQYSKYSSTIRIDLGSGTFPFEYTTDQKGGTYYFYIPSIDRTFTKTIEIPPIDIVPNLINLPDCDMSALTTTVSSCDINYIFIEVPVCDIDYDVTNASVTPTTTPSVTPTLPFSPTPTNTKTPTPSLTPTLPFSLTPTNTPTTTPSVTPTTTQLPPLSIIYTLTDGGGQLLKGVIVK